MSRLREALIDVLAQFRGLILAVEQASSHEIGLYGEIGIGRHVRHVVDHLRQFERGLETGVIDYNRRNRACALEFDPETGLKELERLMLRVQTVPVADESVTVISEVCSMRRVDVRLTSTIQRELLFLQQHSVHHLAYAALLARHHGVAHDVGIGIAPATATWLREQRERSAGR